MDALNSLQGALNARTVQLMPCDLHPEIQVTLDHPDGSPRFTYAQVEGSKVKAIALVVTAEPLHGLPCFQVGYAVTESMRGKGNGTRILQQAIDELKHGLSRTPIKEFYLEAIVSSENVASNKIAKRLISDSPEPCNDSFSEESAYQYIRKVHTST